MFRGPMSFSERAQVSNHILGPGVARTAQRGIYPVETVTSPVNL
jgi:hypothetical protein